MATVAALQTSPAFGDVLGNLAAVRHTLREVEADLIVLPELCSTGYAFRDREEAESLGEPFPTGPTVRLLTEVSARTGALVVGGFVERDGARLYNAAAVVSAGRALLSYRKVHLFGFEREVFDPGPGPFPVVEHQGFRVGVMICFDWRFPEAARTLALAGADVLAHPSNLVMPHAQAAMVTRCLENGVFAVTANRVGTEHRPPRPSLTFTGASVIVSPRGETLARGPVGEPRLLKVEIDPAEARNKRLASGNDVFAERRPDAYRL
jgi:predicted amidohydrolase